MGVGGEGGGKFSIALSILTMCKRSLTNRRVADGSSWGHTSLRCDCDWMRTDTMASTGLALSAGILLLADLLWATGRSSFATFHIYIYMRVYWDSSSC